MTEADWTNAVWGTLSTALGVLLGLLGNAYVIWRQERRAYRAMLTAIASEARNNKAVLDDSFLKYYDNGVVLREFSTTTVGRCVADTLFVKHAKPAHLDIIYQYLRNVSLANSYRERAERLQLGQDGRAAKAWLDGIVDAWGNNLKQCETSMQHVIALAVNSHNLLSRGAANAGDSR